MARQLYSTTQVVESVPFLTYRQLDYWIRKDLYTPYVKGHGSGTRHQFDEFDVFIVRVMACCMKVGVPDEGIKQVIKLLVEEFKEAPKHYSSWALIFDGEHFVVELAQGLASAVEKLADYPDKAVWSIPLAPLREMRIHAEGTVSSGHS